MSLPFGMEEEAVWKGSSADKKCLKLGKSICVPSGTLPGRKERRSYFFFHIDLRYSRFRVAMNLRLMFLGQASSHS